MSELLSLKNKYNKAKGLLKFDKMEAVSLFYEIYQDEDADDKLAAKSLKNAALAISETEDENLMSVLSDVFGAFQDEVFDDQYCSKIVLGMIKNIQNTKILNEFIKTALENIDQEKQPNLYINIKIMQAESSIKQADYTNAEDQLSEIEKIISLTPNPDDKQAVNLATRFLFLKIDYFDLRPEKIEEDIFKCYHMLKSIQDISFTDYQKAVLEKIEGRIALHERKFEKARNLFYSSFDKFNELTSDKRLDCLPFLALSIMCLQNPKDNLFQNPNIKVLTYAAAQFSQLLDAFKIHDYIKFTDLLGSAQTELKRLVANPDFYFGLLEEVRIFVLRENIKYMCQDYLRVQLKFISDQMKCEDQEAKNLVLDLILSEELFALYDTDTDIIIARENANKSFHLRNVEIMMLSMGDLIEKNLKRQEIKFE